MNTEGQKQAGGASESLLGARLDEVRNRIEASARRTGRDPAEITLIAVSKTHPADLIARAIDAGARDLGENRVQEAEEKIAEIARLHLAGADCGGERRVRWHLIGHLQSNKARRAVKLFDLIHTVDSVALVERLERLCEEEDQSELPVLVQLSLAGEAAKAGAQVNDLPAIVERINACARVRPAGLMTMPPFAEDAEESRPYFRRLRELRDEWQERGAFTAGAGELSMGMSHDYEVAIEEGATLVRVGTAIFGAREKPRG
jgi:pyridoxal phosphate enzyme (YggS family)